ncbi:acetyltransferase [Aquirufa antheringensis]|nr:acetyltransferase [Aquirufa antheringensis]
MLLYGASGHGKVISSAAESTAIKVVGIFDDNIKDNFLNSYKILGNYNPNHLKDLPMIISIGNNSIRKNISQSVYHNFGKIFHSTSCIDRLVDINIGTVVLHQAIIQRNCIIGSHCIINTNSIIDHECILEDYIHISPGATLCGNVRVGEGTHIGAGATIIPNINIGKWCVIGAGTVVTKDVPDYSLVVGVPGKVVKNIYNE